MSGAMESVYITSLPILVLCEILKLLDSDSISHISQTCTLFRELVKHYYFLSLIVGNEENHSINTNENKGVLKLMLNIVKCTKSYNDHLFVNTTLANTFGKLNTLNLIETTDVLINYFFIDENLVTYLRDNFTELQSLFKSMRKLKRVKIDIKSGRIDGTLHWDDLKLIVEVMKNSNAKEFVLKVHNKIIGGVQPYILKFPSMVERLVVMGPCLMLTNKRLSIYSDNLRKIVVKSLNELCTFTEAFGETGHINGICVLDVEKVLKIWTIQYYNGVYIADLIHMKQCCSFNVASERLYNSLLSAETNIDKNDYGEK